MLINWWILPSQVGLLGEKNALKHLSNRLQLGCLNSVPQLCLTLCDPMSRNRPGLPVHHQLLELAQSLWPEKANVS